MKPSLNLRKRLYAEGKALIGARRMAHLRSVTFATGRAAARHHRQALGQLRRVVPAPQARIDICIAIDSTSFVVAGAVDPSALSTNSLRAGRRDASLTLPADCFVTPPVGSSGRDAMAGFVARIGLPAAMAADERLCLIADDARSGEPRAFALRPARALPDAMLAIGKLLSLAPREPIARRACFDRVIGPAVGDFWAAHRAALGASDTGIEPIRYNPDLAVPAPRASFVIPLYGRCDFIRHQLAAFAQDRTLDDCELLYVLDDPRMETALRRMAPELAAVHRRPFSILYLTRNHGYADANNLGIAAARGQDVLLLNSDVLPKTSGWLDTMYTAVGGDVTGHLVGARLLYDDGAMQHDGMRLERSPDDDGLFWNVHPGKGLPAELFDGESDWAPRQAVTGACLLMERAALLALGGLDGALILGDFEDSDLCLKARAAGIEVGVATHAQLFHLERQSQKLVTDAGWKHDVTYYNCWYHSRKWRTRLEAMEPRHA